MPRIESLQMSGLDIIIALADGNPGAVTAMAELLKHSEAVDPDSMLGPAGPLFLLDTFEIYGPNIWRLYKDVCDHSVVRMLAVLRAVQLGIVSREQVHQRLTTFDQANRDWADTMLAEVRKQLPAFAVNVLFDNDKDQDDNG